MPYVVLPGESAEHPEANLAGGGFFDLLHLGDRRGPRPPSAPLDQFGYKVWRAFEDSFDSAVRQIANVTRDASRLCLFHAAKPETNSLHLTTYNNSSPH